MNYTDFFRCTITGEDSLFKLAREGRAQGFTIINILLLGILFGLSDLVGALSLGQEVPLEGKFALITPLIFSFSGLVNMMIAVLGLTLVYWSAAKAFGGDGGLTVSFHMVCLSLAPFWVLAPLLNFAVRFTPDRIVVLPMLVPILLSSIWAYRLLCRSLIAGQGIPPFKANLAVTGMVIFSISAIYVLIP